MINLLFFFLTAHAADSFFAQGKPVPQSEAVLQNQISQEVMKVYEPQESKVKDYKGYPMSQILEKIYGAQSQKADTLVFHCQDGYRADIPLKEFSQKKSLLAFAMADGSQFALAGKSGPIPLSPYYLVWDHPNAQSAQKEVYRWPYAVTHLDLIDSKTTYQPLEPKGNQLVLQEGKQLFMQHCFSCHTVNGVGGLRGPYLNLIVPTQKDSFLVDYILDPRRFNKSSSMSGLSKDMKNRREAAQKIVQYLRNVTAPKN